MTLFASPFVSCQSRVVVRFVVFLLFGICWVLLVGISIVFFTTVGCFRSLSGSFHVSHRRTFLLYMSRSIPSDRETMWPEKKKLLRISLASDCIIQYVIGNWKIAPPFLPSSTSAVSIVLLSIVFRHPFCRRCHSCLFYNELDRFQFRRTRTRCIGAASSNCRLSIGNITWFGYSLNFYQIDLFFIFWINQIEEGVALGILSNGSNIHFLFSFVSTSRCLRRVANRSFITWTSTNVWAIRAFSKC